MKFSGLRRDSALAVFWRSLPGVWRALAVLFCIGATAYSADKRLGGAMERNMAIVARTLASLCTNAFSEVERQTGYALVTVTTNEMHDFTMPPNATLATNIALRGASRDGFWHDFGEDSAHLGLPPSNRLMHISTGLAVSTDIPDPWIPLAAMASVPSVTNATVFRAMEGNFGFLPSALWDSICTSRIWTASTPNGSRIVTWENALVGRDPSLPISAQVEFASGRSLIYRYSALSTNLTAGIYHSGTAFPATLQSPTSTLFSYIGDLGDGTDDADSDGLTDWQEIQFGSDPYEQDTDGDGLTDDLEIAQGLNPCLPDSNGDGIPDGWSSGEYAASHIWSGSSPDIVITLEEDLPEGKWIVLQIDGVPTILTTATNLNISCEEGEMREFRLSGSQSKDIFPQLSIEVANQYLAFRLENTGLFSNLGEGVRRSTRSPRRAKVICPKLTLDLDDEDAVIYNSSCVHSSNAAGVHYSLSVEPVFDGEIPLRSEGFEPMSCYLLKIPDDAIGEESAVSAFVEVNPNWLSRGCVRQTVGLHRGSFWPLCGKCGEHHLPTECSSEDGGGTSSGGPSGLGVFLRIGETNSVGRLINEYQCVCCGHELASPLECNDAGHSVHISVSGDGTDNLQAVGTGASAAIGADYLKYEVNSQDGSISEEGEIRYTIADIALDFDYNGDGTISNTEKENDGGVRWAIPHRQEPYAVDFMVKAGTGLDVAAVLASGAACRIFSDWNLSSNVTQSLSETLDRNGTKRLWLATTNANASASLSLGIATENMTILAEGLNLEVRSMELPEYWTLRNGAPLSYEYATIDGMPLWRIISCATTNPVRTATVGRFTVSPSVLTVGDYKVTALDPDLVREGFSHNTATGTLHVIETRLAETNIVIVRNATAGNASGRRRLELAPGSTQLANWSISPTNAGCARLYASATGGEPQTAIANAAAVWVEAGEEGDYSEITARHPHFPQESDTLYVDFIDAAIAPDYDFDNAVDVADFAQSATGRVFTIWLNNDNDDAAGINNHDGSEGGSGYEVPDNDYLYADWSDTKVNGLRDLIDWFPVCLDLSQLLYAFPIADGFSYRFSQADNALSCVWTSLRPNQAGNYLFDDIACAGQNFAQPVTNATVARMSGGRVAIPADFLAQAGHDLVCLVEGRYASSTPLALEVLQGDSLIARIEMPLRVAAVEDMFRFSNLRPPLGGSSSPQSRTGVPPYRPYIPNGKTVFLVHGFRVGANESRGWGSEFFKKLLRSGSRADFWMVTWEGDASPPLDPLGIDYYTNVVNAFATAPHLAALVNSVQGEKIVLAHSLGNMVVSSAIQDYGMQVDKYFALNSAVASEAYDATLFDVATNNPLVHSEWVEYTNTSWSANYHGFFDAGDDRSRLTWRGRFADVPMLTDMFNFYSSGDEVLEIGPQGITVLDWDASVRQYTWHKQEAFKGRNVLYGTGWAGWGFESNVTAQAANTASPETLRDFPIFEHDPDEMFSAAITTNMQNRILAKGIPALSETIGMSTWAPAVGEGIHTYNMNDLTSRRWPRPPVDNSHKWLHSDIQNLSLFFTYGVFSEVVDKGDLDE